MSNPFAQGAPIPGATDPTNSAEVDKVLNANIESIEHAVKVLQGVLDQHDDPDVVLKLTHHVKQAQTKVYALQTAGRNKLWAKFGPGKHATPEGRAFSFTKPSGTRKADYKLLETKYPEAYRDAVTFNPPRPDSVGSLRMLKGKK